MSSFWRTNLYVAIVALVPFIDHITKYYALVHWEIPYQVNRFLGFELVLNRGISWGLFHSSNNAIFSIITLLIVAVLCGVIYLAYQRYRKNELIIGELLVIAGAGSNIMDRIRMGGVIDFIKLSAGDFVWPLFNLADVCIVIGVFIMFVSEYYETR